MSQDKIRCLWCQSGDLALLLRRRDGKAVMHCAHCGLSFVPDMPEDLAELYEASYFFKPGEVGYQDIGYDNYDSIPEIEFSQRLNLLSLVKSQGRRLLDVGCATGKFIEVAARAGWNAEGIEISPFARAVALRKGLTVHLGTVESVALPPESFDVVTAFDVLEHVRDIRSFLRSILTLLKPGGHLVLTTPNAGSFRALMMKEKWIGYARAHEHVHYVQMPFLRKALLEVFRDPHLIVAEYERGEYDYLLGIAQRPLRPAEQETLAEDKPQDGLQVLFVNRADSFWRPGGDVVQMLETKRHLEDRGVTVDISTAEHPAPGRYHLAHIFNTELAPQQYEQARHLKGQGLPVCLSTIYMDHTETNWADRAQRMIFSKDSISQVEEDLAQLRRREFVVPGLSPQTPEPVYEALRSAKERLLETADYLLPNAQKEMEDIRKNHGILNKPFTVIPNGVDSSVFLNADPTPFVEKFGFSSFVLLVGRLEGRKNQLTALYALRDTGLPVVVVGSQADKEYFALCRKWAGPNVLFIDHLPQKDLASIYAAAKVFLLPSWGETPGLVALEAALADCSLVVTNRGTTKEYFGEYAYYCDPGDAQSIREAVLRAYSNFERDSERRERLRKRILCEYSWSLAAERTLEAYRQVLQRKESGCAMPACVSMDRRRYRVSIIIPVFNKAEYTVKCLESLASNTPSELGYEVVIVDNASTDGTQQLLRALEGDVFIIRNDVNLGFAKACNQGARVASGEYLVFLNNDTEPQPGWLEPLLERAQEEDVGIVGARLVFPDGTIQHAGVAIASDKLNNVPVAPYHIYYGLPSEFPAANRTRDLQIVTGACFLIRKDLFEAVGGFSEIYYNGYEDCDLCLRVRALGRRVVYEPRSLLVHHESSSGPERFKKVRDNVILFNMYWRGRIRPDDQDIYLSDGFVARFLKTQAGYKRKLTRVPALSIVLRGHSSQETCSALMKSLAESTSIPVQLAVPGALMGDYIVVVDARAVVSSGWAEGLLKGIEFHPNVGATVPVTNASHIPGDQLGIRDSEGISIVHKLANWLRSVNRGVYTPVGSLDPSFVMLKKEVLDRVMPTGWTHNDLTRLFNQGDIATILAENGYMVLACADTYVYLSPSGKTVHITR